MRTPSSCRWEKSPLILASHAAGPSVNAYLASDENAEVVAANSQLLSEGIDLFRNRPDKDWPLTDCLSFVVMTRCGITDALTGDKHFRQAGFNPLLEL